MVGRKIKVKNVKPFTDKRGKVTIEKEPPKGQSLSRKIAAKKSPKQKVVAPANAGRAK